MRTALRFGAIARRGGGHTAGRTGAIAGAHACLPFDSACAVLAARIRAELEALGTPIGPHDTLIAATALRHHAALVTRNVREFSRVAGLQCLNWHEGV